MQTWTFPFDASHTIRLSAVVHNYGDVFSGRIEYHYPLRDGPRGLLRANGFVSVLMKCCT